MKIGLVAPPWIPVPPPAYGGTESVIDNLARGLRDRGHEVVLFTVGESTCPVARRSFFDRAVTPLGQSLPEASHVLAAYEELRDVDLIHDHTLLGPLVAHRAGFKSPPVATTNHGPFTPASRTILQRVARSAAVVAISRDHAARAGDVPVTAVIHHGIDLERHREGPGGDDLVFVGRMSPDKGVADAVRIAHRSERNLRIISKMREPEERAYFESAVRPLLSRTERDIEELGLTERVEVVRHAAALVNPIRWPEPFGLVMAEALAAGTPVITRPEGAAPEIVTSGVTGLFFGAVSAGVHRVTQVAELRRSDCRAVAEQRFSLQRMAAEHERLYERILYGRIPQPRRRSQVPVSERHAGSGRLRLVP